MKRASYREAIAWIALNDSAGDQNANDPNEVMHLTSAALISDLFQVDQLKVGQDVVKYREKLRGNDD